MKLTFSTLLEHNVCVYVPDGSKMTEKQLVEAVADGEATVLWIENPSTTTVCENALAEVCESIHIDHDDSPLDEDELTALRTGKPEVGVYS